MVASNSALGGGWCEGTTPLTEGRLSDADPTWRRPWTERYASRRTFIGSIRVARRAGSQEATRPTATSTAVTGGERDGSAGVRPKRMLSTTRVSSSSCRRSSGVHHLDLIGIQAAATAGKHVDAGWVGGAGDDRAVQNDRDRRVGGELFERPRASSHSSSRSAFDSIGTPRRPWWDLVPG